MGAWPSLKNRIVEALQSADGDFVSGEALAERFGVSRAAVWKAVSQLKAEGFPIVSAHRRGYRLAEDFDPLVDADGGIGARTEALGQAVRYFPTVDSTQNAAKVWLAEGAPHGAVVLAEQQTAGRGRMGRTWLSPPGRGIWMSVILTDGLTLTDVHALSLLGGLAVAEALTRFGYDPALKWPNDVLLDGKKAAGVLIEGQGELDRLHHAIVGIGVNVKAHADDFPAELRKTATALAEHGAPPRRLLLVRAILEALEAELAVYRTDGFSRLRARWMARAAFLERTIAVRTAERNLSGRFVGLTERGMLVLRTDEGIVEVASGEVLLT
ncbi:MAG: biotin--[acetyl-CoA-carboxylase] ligase [Hydrogenibacillus sp.]|nr:biotin--[acetyl-CoA-carboxylase] ligase [Hydrogenibacillus sp.]